MNNFEKLQSENVRAEAQDAILVLPVGAVEQHAHTALDGGYRNSDPDCVPAGREAQSICGAGSFLRRSFTATDEIGLALCEEICSQFIALIQEHMGAAPLCEKGAPRKS